MVSGVCVCLPVGYGCLLHCVEKVLRPFCGKECSSQLVTSALEEWLGAWAHVAIYLTI